MLACASFELKMRRGPATFPDLPLELRLRIFRLSRRCAQARRAGELLLRSQSFPVWNSEIPTPDGRPYLIVYTDGTYYREEGMLVKQAWMFGRGKNARLTMVSHYHTLPRGDSLENFLVEDQIPRDNPRYVWWKTILSTEDEASSSLRYHDDGHPGNVREYDGLYNNIVNK